MDGRRRKWVPHDVDFYAGDGRQIYPDFGHAGWTVWFAFLGACQKASTPGRMQWRDEADALSLMGLNGIPLRNNDGQPFTLEEFFRKTGQLHWTRTSMSRKAGGLHTTIARNWDKWQPRDRSGNRQQQRPAATRTRRAHDAQRSTPRRVNDVSTTGSRRANPAHNPTVDNPVDNRSGAGQQPGQAGGPAAPEGHETTADARRRVNDVSTAGSRRTVRQASTSKRRADDKQNPSSEHKNTAEMRRRNGAPSDQIRRLPVPVPPTTSVREVVGGALGVRAREPVGSSAPRPTGPRSSAVEERPALALVDVDPPTPAGDPAAEEARRQFHAALDQIAGRPPGWDDLPDGRRYTRAELAAALVARGATAAEVADLTGDPPATPGGTDPPAPDLPAAAAGGGGS